MYTVNSSSNLGDVTFSLPENSWITFDQSGTVDSTGTGTSINIRYVYENKLTPTEEKGEERMEMRITEDGLVEVVKTEIVKRTTIDSLLNSFNEARPVSSGLLPNNCFTFMERAGTKLFLIECMPGLRHIRYHPFSCDREIGRAPLSLPFLYFAFKVSPAISVSVRCSRKRLASMDDPVYLSPLLNIHGGGVDEMCTGRAISVNANEPNHIRINSFMDQVWDTVWQHDLSPAMPSGYSSYEDLILDSHDDPALWSKLTYKRYESETVSSWMTRLGIPQ